MNFLDDVCRKPRQKHRKWTIINVFFSPSWKLYNYTHPTNGKCRQICRLWELYSSYISLGARFSIFPPLKCDHEMMSTSFAQSHQSAFRRNLKRRAVWCWTARTFWWFVLATDKYTRIRSTEATSSGIKCIYGIPFAVIICSPLKCIPCYYTANIVGYKYTNQLPLT